MSARFPMRVATHSAAETRALGGAIASLAVPGDVILLRGELGAGKTTLTKGLVAALGGGEVVTSPTFTLCHRYETEPPVAHIDCFRLEADDDLADLTLDELLEDGYVLVVEWGDRARSVLGPDVLWCSLTTANELDASGADDRVVEIDAAGVTWTARVATLASAITSARLSFDLSPESAS